MRFKYNNVENCVVNKRFRGQGFFDDQNNHEVMQESYYKGVHNKNTFLNQMQDKDVFQHINSILKLSLSK